MRLFVRSRDLLVVPSRRRKAPGPAPAALQRMLARGMPVADLERLDDDELAVAFLPGSRDDERTRERIRDWAELVGFRRLWLPGAFVPLDPAARDLGPVHARCSCCGASFAEDGPDFWAMVRRNKLFPTACLVCGGALAQWLPRAARPQGSDPGRPRRRSAPVRSA
jgi:hypothetical protein